MLQRGGIAGWETVWQQTEFCGLSPSDTSESGPGPENGRQCNKGYLLGQAQSSAQAIVVTCPNSYYKVSERPLTVFAQGPKASALHQTSSPRHAPVDPLPPGDVGLPRRRRVPDRSRTASSP